MAISKSHIIDANTGITIGQHPLVKTTKKAFWQIKPPIPRSHGTYYINTVLRFIENFGQNEILTMNQLTEKTAFLVVFSTLDTDLSQFSSLKIFISPICLTVLLRVSSVLVLGVRSMRDQMELWSNLLTLKR